MHAYLAIIGRWYWRPRKAYVHDVDCVAETVVFSGLVHTVASIIAIFIIS
jgi:hypothetical protein